MKKYQSICVICKTSFLGSRPTVKTCTKQCTGKYQSGSNNPNFGNSWSAEQRKKASSSKKKQYADSPEYRYKVGSSNRGVKFDDDRIKRMHEHRTPDSYKRSHTDESKKLIGTKSKEKFTPEFKEKFRQTMEDNGQWIKLADKDPYDIFFKEANWISSMVDFFDDNEKKMLNEIGMFNQYNSKGWVRDHIVPRRVGFDFNLPPQILRHPANMQFVSHSDNISKGFSDRKLTKNQKECIIESLLNRIENFNDSWQEQEFCLNFIKERKAI
jgi:hypothetical protein